MSSDRWRAVERLAGVALTGVQVARATTFCLLGCGFLPLLAMEGTGLWEGL